MKLFLISAALLLSPLTTLPANAGLFDSIVAMSIPKQCKSSVDGETYLKVGCLFSYLGTTYKVPINPNGETIEIDGETYTPLHGE